MGEKEAVLLERAEGEEKAYNWGEAANLYKQAAKTLLDKKRMEEAAEVYYKTGFAYYRAADTVETAEEHTEVIKNSVKALKEAVNLYSQTQSKAKGLECEALALSISTFIMSSVSEVKSILNKAHEFFIEASELYFKRNDQESYIRTLNKTSYFLIWYICLCSDPKEMEEYYEKGIDIAFKAWNLSKDIKNIQYLAGALYNEVLLCIIFQYFKYVRDYTREEYCRELLLRCEDSLRLVEGCDESHILGLIYSSVGFMSYNFGFHYIEDEVEQNKYIDKAIDSLEKGLEFFKKTKDKGKIVISLFNLILLPASAERINYIQKRIMNDVNELVEIGKIYRNTYLPWHFIAYEVPAFYYSIIARWSFFTSTQRKSYAEKAIEYAQESLKKLAFPPFISMSYTALTMSHSVLAYLITDKDEKEEHIKKMLQYAQQSNEIGEKYQGGHARSTGYYALDIAYNTLADNTESEEERIKMLTTAADASKKHIKYALYSRTGNISAQMRLGVLYEKIGIISMNKDTLMTAKELFLQLIEQCLKRGYQSYAAAAYEYIARIEDRLGNHNTSAQYYENAQNAYAETLKIIEYKPLKKRVNEKMNYIKAWNLIENAKAYHKKENHLKAQETYQKACEILKDLASFKYESLYYSAWASQEEAEHLSKQEEHEKALEQYEMSKRTFNDAIETMEEISNRSKNKVMVERIKKLIQVANLRIKYCSARTNVEKAIIRGKSGEHSAAAELFASAASQFRYVCNFFKIERERVEIEAVYYLCRAWECMENAEKYEEPDRFSEAANLFIKASNLFSDSKLKFLASGNSTFCQALEIGCKFDEAHESEVKAELYPKIKGLLRNAASTYEKGDFENGSNWALATSTYFDAAWHLIRADEEMNLDEKSRFLEVGSGLLKSTAEIFSDAGYKEKEKEVLKRLSMVEKEEKIIFSALNSIKKPDISSSTIGIIAPACSLETSQSPKLGEIQQMTEESRSVLIKRAESSIEEPKSAYKTDLTVPEVSVKKSIFLSYSTLDSDYFQIPTIVERLKLYPEIENVSFWEADSGENVVEFMEKTLGKSNVFVLFCSENSMKSEAVKGEWQAAYQIRKKGRIKIVPVYESDDNIPNLLMPMLNVKFTRDDFNGFIGTLYNEILR